MRRFVGIILNAKYRVEKDHKDIGVIIPLDDEELKFLMTKALRRYFNALRSNEKHIKGGWEQAAQLLADHIFKAEAADYDPAA